MAKISFENVPGTVDVGTSISGALVVEADRPIDPAAIRVDLVGAEKAFLTRPPPRRSRAGPVLVQEEQRFLESSVGWDTGGQVTGSTYRLPFSFPLPADTPPTLRTEARDLAERRTTVLPPRFGMFAEYTLQGRVEHRMWLDTIEYQVVHVVPPRGPLGSVSSVHYMEDARSITLMVNPSAPTVEPGVPFSGFFELLNPRRVDLETLTVALRRRVSYSAKGNPHSIDWPSFEQEVPLPRNQDKLAGPFLIPVPVSVETIPPARGALFATQWLLVAKLAGGHLTEPLTVEAPVGPPPGPSFPSA